MQMQLSKAEIIHTNMVKKKKHCFLHVGMLACSLVCSVAVLERHSSLISLPVLKVRETASDNTSAADPAQDEYRDRDTLPS